MEAHTVTHQERHCHLLTPPAGMAGDPGVTTHPCTWQKGQGHVLVVPQGQRPAGDTHLPGSGDPVLPSGGRGREGTAGDTPSPGLVTRSSSVTAELGTCPSPSAPTTVTAS